METVELIQGTDKWLEYRRTKRNSSDASAMYGISPHTKRDELLKLSKTGTDKEFSDYVQKHILDNGHKTEAAQRPLIEAIIDEELYPVTGYTVIDGIELSASYDGINMMETIVFEHKDWNAEKAAKMEKADKVLPEYEPQLDQQIAVCPTIEKILFVMSDGTADNRVIIEYTPVRGRTKKLVKHWQQFEKDLEDYEVKPEEVKAVGKALEPLPVLSVMTVGEVKESNLPAYKAAVTTFIENINEDLKTDQQFADAEQAVKGLKKGEDQAKNMVQSILGQTVTIKEVIDTIEYLGEEMRQKRLFLDNKVKAEKDARRAELVGSAEQEITAHIEALNNSTEPYTVGDHDADFWAAVKGKKTIDSMVNAIGVENARVVIMLNEHAELINANAAYLNETAGEYLFLFRDKNDIVHSEADYFRLMVNERITNHKAEEDRKAKAKEERIRAEEQANAQREAKEKAETERKKIREEERARAEKKAAQPAEEKDEVGITEPAPHTKPEAAASTHTQPATFDPGKDEQSKASVTVYATCNKDRMYEIGESLGMTGDALRMFANFNEVKLQLSVDLKTGVVEHYIIAQDEAA